MFEQLPGNVRIVEVGPRDGLQNEATPILTEDKLRFIEMLSEAGEQHIEITSFVRKDKIPQLGDAVELVPQVLASKKIQGVNLSCLVPNLKGMEAAVASRMKEISLFTATSETFSKRNTNATIEETFERFQPVMMMARKHHIRVRGYLSTVFGCPYEGDIAVSKVESLTLRLLEMGVDEVSLGDTIGVATPRHVQAVLTALAKICPKDRLAMHFHDTRGMAIANILVSLEMGITTFDSSAGGLGGCPYAKGASGNVATEDVVYLMEQMDIKTGIDLKKLILASGFILKKLGKPSSSKVHQAFMTNYT